MFGNFNKPTFGSTAFNTSFGFGSNSTASTNPFGQSQPFGRSATGATGPFESPFSSTFGQSANTSLFPATQTQPTNVFQNANTTFGAPTRTSGGFGSSNPFGQQQPSTNSPFNTSTFGQQNKPSSFGFGTQPSLFGQQKSRTFQSSTTPFITGTVIKFNSVIDTDCTTENGVVVSIKTKNHSITCMKEYDNKSFEELRFEDYLANRKGTSNPFEQQKPSASGFLNINTTFGQPNKPPGFSFSARPSPFGQQARRRLPRTFPATSSNLFGGTTGFGSQKPAGTVIKFNPVTSTGIRQCNGVVDYFYTKCYSITCMKEYEDKSFEELRFEDYFANRKGLFNPFGRQQPFTSGLFNTSSTFGQQSKPFGFDFGTQSTQPSLFGQPPQQQQSSIFQPATSNHFSGTTGSGDQQSVGMVFNCNPVFTKEPNDKLHSITCEKEYEDKSFEELRFENYLANGKCPQQAGFGAASLGTVATCIPSPFGQTSASRPSFGATMGGFQNTRTFFGKTENKSGGTTTTTTFGMMMFVTKSTSTN